VHQFSQVDALTDQLAYGDPLVVVHGADGLLIGSALRPHSYESPQKTLIGRLGRDQVSAVGDQVWVGDKVVAGVSGTIAR
jgi:hypothetical protein